MTSKKYAHLKVVGGLYLPKSDPGTWLIRDGVTKDGFAKYQYDRIEAVLALCANKRTCVDGGAHVGAWTIHLVKHFKLVHAFEPIPANFECLNINTHVIPNVAIHPYALSIRNGDVPLAPAGGKSFQWRVDRNAPIAALCPCIILDDLNLTDLDLLKLDVEGHEFEALNGAILTILRCRPVVIIEEKFDQEFKATNFLISLGMDMVAQLKHDRIFTWPPPTTTTPSGK